MVVVRRLLAAVLLLSAWSSYAADGTFEGKVVDTPAREQSIPGWIFIQGRNHALRRVEVAHATIFLGRHGDRRQRRCNLDCLSIGQEILITAEQDPSGEWHAKRVEILWPLVNRSAIRGASVATTRPVRQAQGQDLAGGLPSRSLALASLTCRKAQPTDPSTSLGISLAGLRLGSLRSPRSRPQNGLTLRNFTT